ncbi:MAG: hypothetical protein K9L26_02120 [Candidatus Izimaplasma sp.]|nr:hypothetical protein [Candidatus Izimaplasma bacterium]
MGSYLLVALLLAGIISLYILSYKWNKDTKAPTDDKALFQCASCAVSGSCSVKDEDDKDDEACETEHKGIGLKEYYYSQKESS